MDDAACVSGRESARDLSGDPDCVGHGDGAACETCAERFALDELGHDEGPAVELAEVVNHQNVRMVERRDRPRFSAKPLQAIRIARQLGRQHLQRNGTIELRIVRAVDFPHTACGDLRLDAVAADRAADDGLDGHIQADRGF